MSPSCRPRWCSRIRYASTRSSADERAKRNENGFVTKLRRRSTAGNCNGIVLTPRAVLFHRGPLQVGVRNRIAVRIVGREAEGLVDPFFELLGDRVLEPVGFGVDVVDGEPERLGQIELQQPVVP